jgi:hypothetical protein
MSEIVGYLLERPILLAPLLLVVATLLYGVLRRLVKMAAIAAIAGVLYVLLIEYFGGGL